jgi:transcriptional regulator of arginine metabolism
VSADPGEPGEPVDPVDAVAGVASPQTKTARRQRVVTLLGRRGVRSQAELARLLADEGFAVTQATLSRDLDELGAVRIRDDEGALVYAVPGEGGDRSPRAAGPDPSGHGRLVRVAVDLLVSAEASANLVVLRTPPGGAHFLASALDHVELPEVLGTVAGDDTVLLVCRRPDGGQEVADRLLALAGRGT